MRLYTARYRGLAHGVGAEDVVCLAGAVLEKRALEG